VHHALGFAGGARGIDELGDVVGAGAVGAQNAGGIGILFPGRSAEQSFVAVGALPVHHHDVFQLRQVRLDALDHLLEVKATEGLGRDDDLGLSVLEHEVEFALAEDVHQRVDHGANARAGQVGHGELPPVGQLAGDHVVLFHPQTRQAHGHAVGHLRQLAVAEAAHVTRLHPVRRQRALVRAGGDTGVQVVVDGAVMPEALLDHAGAARGQQYGVEFHGCLLVFFFGGVWASFRPARTSGRRDCAR